MLIYGLILAMTIVGATWAIWEFKREKDLEKRYRSGLPESV